MNFDEEKLDKLLKDASALSVKIPAKEKTFMDISGYPHYENVSSNILSFYFNPNEEHDLGNLVINAFLETIKSKGYNIDDIDTSYFDIFREYTTINGNRLDILLMNNDVVIGIENKIHASLYNDLSDYSKTIDNLKGNKTFKIVLSLYNNDKNVHNTDFINITYKDFFDRLKLSLENCKDEKNKWYIFLQEFIKNLEGYKGDMEMEKEIIEWMKQHQDEINEFNKIKCIVDKNIENKTNDLKKIIETKLSSNNIKTWGKDLEKGCYINSTNKYNIDATLSYTEWKLGIFTWVKTNSGYIKQIIMNSNYNLIEDDGNHRWLFKYEYNEDLNVISDKFIEIYNYVERQI